jgi:hypothetical protein
VIPWAGYLSIFPMIRQEQPAARWLPYLHCSGFRAGFYGRAWPSGPHTAPIGCRTALLLRGQLVATGTPLIAVTSHAPPDQAQPSAIKDHQRLMGLQ